MLFGVAKKMALVVMLQAAVGRGPQQAIEYASIGAQLHAAGDGGIEPPGLLFHPGDRRPVHRFGLIDGLVAESAGEGFRQQHHIGDAAQRRDQVGVIVAVAGRVVPAGFALYQRDAEIVHGAPCFSCVIPSVARDLLSSRKKTGPSLRSG